jgi:serine phosphatase RsbU (regulator of sigma subunit)
MTDVAQPFGGERPPAAAVGGALSASDGRTGDLTSNPAAPPLCALVVDDDPAINQLLQIRLQTHGFTVMSAADGAEALALLADRTPDLVLCDVSMPHVDGLEVLERVRADGLNVAIIMTTAFGSEQVAIEALRRGADDYLRKPFQGDEFRAVIDRTVARLLLARENSALQYRLNEHRRHLEAELQRAAEVQARLQPAPLPRVDRFEVAGRCVPAHQVGGDFYDWQRTADGALLFTLGDVMGKGMPAALLMATVRAALRSVAPTQSPRATVAAVDAAIEADLAGSGSFATLFHGRLDPRDGRVRFVDAGHGLAVVRWADGRTLQVSPRGVPLGIATNSQREEGSLILAPGDALVVFSDGLADGRPDLAIQPDAIGRELEVVVDAQAMVDRLIDVGLNDRPLQDDLTVLAVLRRTESSGG